MKKYDVKLLKYEDEQYPECLRNIHTPPTKLYCMGNINLLNNFKITSDLIDNTVIRCLYNNSNIFYILK